MPKNIILIDKRVQDYETILAAVDTNICIPVLFDYYTDTVEDIKRRITDGVVNDIAETTEAVAPRCIGLLQHNYNRPFYNLVAANAETGSAASSIISGVTDHDPDLASWAPLRDLITWCATTLSIQAGYFDMMACALYANKDWKYIIDTLTAQTGVIIRASTDDTGAAAMGGDWFLESHTGVNLKTVYFTEAIEEYRGILFVYSYNIREYSTKGFATGSIQAWGDSGYETDRTPGTVSYGVVTVYSNNSVFAALKTDGSVVAWGNPYSGGTTPENVSSGVIAVYSNAYAFAALKTDGSIVAWGDSHYGYGGATPENVSSGVVAVYSNDYAFAALKTDGSVVAWGGANYGGTTPGTVSSGVIAIYSNPQVFAALKTDGSVVAWGNSSFGGTTPGTVSSGVVAVYSNIQAFAALKTDGSVITWGGSFGGGNSSQVSTSLTSGVVAVYSNDYAFAALKTDGSVVAWGGANYGGTTPGTVSSGVVAVYSNGGTFAALKTTATTFDLSMSYYTDMDRYDILRKKENRRRVNLTTLNNNVFTLSGTRNLQVINPNIPSDQTLRIIVPDYVSSPLSITSTATIPTDAGSVIIACDEGEPVTISGITLVNYGAYVYRRETNNTFTKLTTVTIGPTEYPVFGGDGVNSSGIALLILYPFPTISNFQNITKVSNAPPFQITPPHQ